MIKAVLGAVRVQIGLIPSLNETLDSIHQCPGAKTQSDQLSNMLKIHQAELDKLVTASDSLYIDWKNRVLTGEDYRRMKASFGEKADSLRTSIENIQTEASTLARGRNSVPPYLAAFTKSGNITEINRGIAVELIDTIYVHKDGKITIDFSFADEIKRFLDLILSWKGDVS